MVTTFLVQKKKIFVVYDWSRILFLTASLKTVHQSANNLHKIEGPSTLGLDFLIATVMALNFIHDRFADKFDDSTNVVT